MALYKNTDTGDVDWKEFTFTEPEELRYLVTDTWALRQEPITAFRVKHLDKEDIESLGFKQITYDCFNLDIEDRELRMLYDNDKIVIFFADSYSEILFNGTIKNKSELKRILKQLGI